MVKVRLSLFLIKHHTIKIYGGEEVQLQPFLTLDYMEVNG
jgi:hypothetical protein